MALGKAAHARSARPYTATSPAPHFWYGWQHRDTSRDARARAEQAEASSHGVATALFGF
jgi:hypothetical protein